MWSANNFFTFTHWFSAIPGPVLGADERGGPGGVHGEARWTLESDCVVVGEITPQPHAIGRHSRVATVDYCREPQKVKSSKHIKRGRAVGEKNKKKNSHLSRDEEESVWLALRERKSGQLCSLGILPMLERYFSVLRTWSLLYLFAICDTGDRYDTEASKQINLEPQLGLRT